MKQLFIPVLAFITIMIGGCVSSKKSKGTNPINQNTSICDKAIRYTIEKVKMIEGGNEIKIHAEITIDPSSKNINLNADLPDGGKKTFDTQIESIECTFNENLTSGQATYKGYIKQDDGRKTWTSLSVEPKDGQLLIRSADQNNPGQVSFVVDKWEMIEH
jgi:hypothetical protein